MFLTKPGQAIAYDHPAMRTVGVDLASQPAKTALCEVSWETQPASVAELILGVDDATIGKRIVSADKLGIDVPLGWPLAFVEAVSQHSEDGSWPSAYDHEDTTAVRFRRTDLWLQKELGLHLPLSVSTDRIALPAMRAAALLSGLPSHVALDGSGVVVEVYPAAALRRWGFPSQNYKGKDHEAGRRELVERFIETAAWLSIGSDELELCRRSDDAFDALVAALVARAAAVGLVEPIPPDGQDAALREGWIAVPCIGSLAKLTHE